MKRFVAEQNIRHFKRLLETETDPERREVVERLLGEARGELAALDRAARRRDAERASQTNDNGERSGDQSGSSTGRG